MRRYRRPPRLAPLASEGGGTEKRTLHVLQKPDISFATDTGETHGLRPAARIDMYRRAEEFFDRMLKGAG